jgi:excisionase family DNA binding protein
MRLRQRYTGPDYSYVWRPVTMSSATTAQPRKRTHRQPRPAPRYVSITKAAAYADVGRRTISRWIETGDLSAYRAGPRLVRVDLNDLDALIRPIPAVGAAAGR